MSRKWLIDVPVRHGGMITSSQRADLRRRRAEQNEKFRLMGRKDRIGRFKRFVLTHAHGMMAEFVMVE